MGFFKGIYGFDFLSMFLILLSLIFSIWQPTRIVGLLLYAVVIYRAFSRDIYRRRNENNKFRSWINKYLGKLGLSIPDNFQNLDSASLPQLFSRRKYKTVICPGCRKKLKLPRGRGKVIITCRTCSTEFKAKV
jgi:LSD1 subclass zinc finger protein